MTKVVYHVPSDSLLTVSIFDDGCWVFTIGGEKKRAKLTSTDIYSLEFNGKFVVIGDL